MKEIYQHIEKIKELCDFNSVKSPSAFGSIVDDNLSQESDLDFVVEINDEDPLSYSDKYFNLKFSLERIFNRKIDLLKFKALKNKLLKQKLTRRNFKSMDNDVRTWLFDIDQ